MREIKFRSWLKCECIMVKWHSAFFSDTSPVTYYSSDFPEPDDDDVILMQFTGLKDSEGVEIYEGDIIVGFFVWGCVAGVVEYDETEAAFVCKKPDRFSLSDHDINNFEVKGNIYENPDLI